MKYKALSMIFGVLLWQGTITIHDTRQEFRVVEDRQTDWYKPLRVEKFQQDTDLLGNKTFSWQKAGYGEEEQVKDELLRLILLPDQQQPNLLRFCVPTATPAVGVDTTIPSTNGDSGQ